MRVKFNQLHQTATLVELEKQGNDSLDNLLPVARTGRTVIIRC